MSVVIKGSEPFDVMIASNIVNCQTANIKFKNISFQCETIEDAAGTVFVKMPSAQPEWNNHTVACLLAELFDDPCACNYNGIDEWLPEKCEVIDSCPHPVGVACWEQYLKHRAERRTDE